MIKRVQVRRSRATGYARGLSLHLVVSVAAAVTFTGAHVAPASAQAQRASDKPRLASEAFKGCREQQKLGDATACYKLWLQKWKDVANEGEVAYSEEHSGRKEPDPAAPIPKEVPPVTAGAMRVGSGGFLLIRNVPEEANVELDGVALANGNHELKSRLPVDAGEHTVRVVDSMGGATNHKVIVQPGEMTSLDVGKPAAAASNPPSATDAPAGQLAPGSSAGIVKGDVLDFCALKPKESTGKFEKQRVVLYAAGETNQIEDDASIKQASGGTVLRDVFAGRFPLPRFHNVAAHASAPKGWESRESITMAELAGLSAVGTADDDAVKKRGAAEDAFVRYSLACTDYVAVPTITSHKAEWQEQQVKDSKGNTRTVKTLKLSVSGSLGIFKREGASFRRVAQLNASVPSFVDLATDTATMTAAAATNSVKIGGMDALSAISTARELPKYVSAVPDVSCLAGKAALEGLAGLASCARRATARSRLRSATWTSGSVRSAARRWPVATATARRSWPSARSARAHSSSLVPSRRTPAASLAARGPKRR